MSRLDSFIRRMQAQRDCINWAADLIRAHDGVVFELGLGNGRTYDHLRECMPDRDIYVFERKVNAHPACIPPDAFLYLGEVSDTLPKAIARFEGQVAFVHSDIGTGHQDYNKELAAIVSDLIPPALAPGAVVLSDQSLDLPGTDRLPLPEGIHPERYHMYRFSGG